MAQGVYGMTISKDILKDITDTIVDVASGNMTKRIALTNVDEERDAIAIGINMLFEELESMVKLQNAKTKALMNMMEDMEETKRILEENEENLRSITSAAQDAIIKVDDQGNILFWNPAAEKTFGYTENEAIGRSLHKTIVPKKYHADIKNAGV